MPLNKNKNKNKNKNTQADNLSNNFNKQPLENHYHKLNIINLCNKKFLIIFFIIVPIMIFYLNSGIIPKDSYISCYNGDVIKSHVNSSCYKEELIIDQYGIKNTPVYTFKLNHKHSSEYISLYKYGNKSLDDTIYTLNQILEENNNYQMSYDILYKNKEVANIY